MTQAESPSLRRLASQFGQVHDETPEPSRPLNQERVTEGIEKGVWNLVLKHTNLPTVRATRASLMRENSGTSVSSTAELGGESISQDTSVTAASEERRCSQSSETLRFWDDSFFTDDERPVTPSRTGSPISWLNSSSISRSQSRSGNYFTNSLSSHMHTPSSQARVGSPLHRETTYAPMPQSLTVLHPPSPVISPTSSRWGHAWQREHVQRSEESNTMEFFDEWFRD